MTVNNETNRSGPYNGNGVTTSFNYDFRIVDASHLQVILRNAAGVETVQTLGVHYTVTGVNNPNGTIAMVTPPATGETITIIPNVPFTQNIDLENQGAYYAETVERGFDLAAMRDKQLKELVDRAVKIPPSEDPSVLASLIAQIIRIYSSVDNVDTVADSIDAIDTLAPLADDIVANLADITNFADVYLGPKTADPTTRNDGSALQQGDLYFNTTTSSMRVRSSAAWIDAGSAPLNMVPNNFTGNGSQTAFTLSANPGVVQNVIVWLGGVRQRPGVAYTVSGTTLTFAVAPPNGVAVDTLVLLATSTIGVPADLSVTTAKLADGALAATAQGRAKMADDFLTLAKLNSALVSDLKWLSKAVGEFYFADDGVTGVDIPPSSTSGSTVWVELTAGLTGSGQFNENKLTSESVSGSAPLVLATAVVSLSGSPMNGQTIRLLNTERRILRAGSAGTLQNDALQNITGSIASAQESFSGATGALAVGAAGTANRPNNGTASTNGLTFDASLVARTDTETRMKNIGVRVFRRIK